jgi:hypothetical protein
MQVSSEEGRLAAGIVFRAILSRVGRLGVARIVRLITRVVVAIIAVGIVLVVLEANRGNEIVDWLVEAAEFLVQPFDNLFDLDGRKAEVAVNWGLAALVYAFVGGVIVRLLRRLPS